MARQDWPAKISQKASWPQPNPALKNLEVLLGEWNMELFDAPFLPNPSDKVQAYTSFSWAQEGACVAMTQGAAPPVPADVVWLFGRDAPGFLQRFEEHVSADGNRIEARWEKSVDGKPWEQDFKMTYTKIK